MMIDLELLIEGNSELLELAQGHDRIGFAHAASRVLRGIVVTFADRIKDADPNSTLRLRLEPTHAYEPNIYTPASAPTRLVVKSGDLAWGIPIRVGETISFIGETMVVTHRDGATMRLAEALVAEIRKCLGGGAVEPDPEASSPDAPAANTARAAFAQMKNQKAWDL